MLGQASNWWGPPEQGITEAGQQTLCWEYNETGRQRKKEKKKWRDTVVGKKREFRTKLPCRCAFFCVMEVFLIRHQHTESGLQTGCGDPYVLPGCICPATGRLLSAERQWWNRLFAECFADLAVLAVVGAFSRMMLSAIDERCIN